MGYRVINGKIQLVDDISSLRNNSKSQINRSSKVQGNEFKDILNKAIDKKDSFIISKHAEERLKLRNIQLSKTDMQQINEGINKAQEKGSSDCLICYKGNALVTSIKNRTVITAVDQENTKGNVYTNIDSVLFL